MRIHFIAIGGSIMHSLAIAMHRQGHHVTGSDDEIYEPSRGRLLAHGLLPDQFGWHPELLDSRIDLVVLGMHARKDNPELARAKELGLKVMSFPEFMYDLSRDKIRVVVAGSHGKTTTSGMIAHIVDHAGVKADRMIGAAIGELEPVVLTNAGIIILEGDEYLSSPDDSRPKFLHYRPQITVITGVAWDHMNVFPTYESYKEPFNQLIKSLGPTDTLIYCSDDADLTEMVHSSNSPAQLIPYSMLPYEIEDGVVVLTDDDGEKHPLKIFGIHNMQNLSAAKWVIEKLGLVSDAFYYGARSFEGAQKRLQLIHKDSSLTAYLDFAHAPSKVKATVKAVREKHSKSHLVAILELHTFSSLNPDFLPQYKNSLNDADVKILYYSPHTLSIKKLPDLSSDQLAAHFNANDLMIATNGADLEAIVRQLELKENNVVLWMSSGRFDGLEIRQISADISKKTE